MGIHLERLGGVLFLGELRRLDLLGERRLRLLTLRLRGLSGLLALFFPLQVAQHSSGKAAAKHTAYDKAAHSFILPLPSDQEKTRQTY